MVEIGIVGLPQSGKTTIFNAVTRGAAQVAGHAAAHGKLNIGVAKVLDARLDLLEGVFKPKRKIPAEVTYLDLPAPPEGSGASRGISGEHLNYLQRVDALMVVARAFEDPSVPAAGEAVDPVRDAETMLYELAFADLEILERRLARLVDSFKGAKAAERDALNREQALLARLKEALEAGTPIRNETFNPDESRLLEGFQFSTAKPLFLVANVGERQSSDLPTPDEWMSRDFAGHGVLATALCGKLEMELAQMEPAEELEFRESLGLGESGLNRMIGLSRDVLDLITFFTGNSNEVRAWTVGMGTNALEAAGRVHSDFERGFIRAEVVRFDDLAQWGSISEARRHGVLRQEGRSYVVSEGDVVNILFNV